jgi:hypothetical protein
MFSFFKRFARGHAFVVVLFLCLFAACQPMTRRDRAVLGPDATPVPDTSQGSVNPDPSGPTGQSPDNSAGPSAAGGSGRWENDQKTACDAGKPSGCSALAYEALRAQRLTVAQQLFTRACLLDESAERCSQPVAQSKGLARSCFELSGLLQRQGQPEESRKFKTCACERGYRPACVL